MQPRQQTSTSWIHVFIAFLGGCTLTIHIGKIPAAIPFFMKDLGIDLFAAGILVSALPFLSGSTGIIMGGYADKLGHIRSAVFGLIICGLASLFGATATSFSGIIILRIFEGLGYLLATVSLPALIVSSSTEKDRPVALGIWGAFFPVGMASILLLSPYLILTIKWQGLWIVTGSVTLIWGIILSIAFRGRPGPTRETVPITAALKFLTKKGPLLLAGCFVMYSAQFLAITSFLPAMLIDIYTLSVNRAATLGALVIAGNIIGNISSGLLLRLGIPRHVILAAAAAASAICTLIVFNDFFSMFIRVGSAFAFTTISGLIPGTLSASAPHYIERPGQMASIVGLMMQFAAIGQIIGPIILSATVDGFGSWEYASIFTISAALFGVVFAVILSQVKTADNL